ncbi:hypothetical protein [Burkholderia ambifaria]|nr:hypothetical protein [Burkholderia ambifaria]WDR86094.1 hypothetical protein OR986_06670 [Burkholderia ambifaria]WDR98726.1 hypothetical protein OR985_11630 [Burkholderia ambifaria]
MQNLLDKQADMMAAAIIGVGGGVSAEKNTNIGGVGGGYSNDQGKTGIRW